MGYRISTLTVLLSLALPSFAHATPPKLLLVVAHPDDEYFFAATSYHLAQERGAQIDQLIITDGEGGFRYSGPSEKIYGKKLSTEAIGRRELPAIRRKEVEASGKILGIRKHFYLNEKDATFTRDLQGAMKGWNSKNVVREIARQLRAGRYDYVLTLLPTSRTHGGHQAATLLALQAVKDLPMKDRPVVLGAFATSDQSPVPDSDAAKDQAAALSYQEMPDYLESRVAKDSPVLKFNRKSPLPGSPPQLTYQLIVNWMIAEHKSQGLYQTNMGKDDWEQFKIFEEGPVDAVEKAKKLF